MKKLIKSELLVNKYFFLINLLLPFFLIPIVIGESKTGLYITFTINILIISIHPVNSIIREKSRNNIDVLYLSLPVYREYIIKSRYMVYSIFPLVSSILLYLLIVITQWEFLSYHRQIIAFDIVAISISITLIILSFIIPLAIKEGKIIGVIDIVIYFLPLIGFAIIKYYNIDYARINLPYGYKSLIVLIVAIVVYLSSMKISNSIFKKQIRNME